jgi:hypothetical protein
VVRGEELLQAAPNNVVIVSNEDTQGSYLI